MAEPIVVGTDGSDTAELAIAEAFRLSKALEAELHVVSAFEPVRGARISGAPEAAAKIWSPMPDSEVEQILSEVATRAKTRGVSVTTHALRRAPADALLEVAEKVGAGMIVVGSKGMHGVERLKLGNVPNQISHRAHCNVLIVNTART